MKTVIGIISYLHDNIEKQNKRLCLLLNLLSKCYNLFQLPVIIIAQNWKSELVRVPWATIYRYDDKLGIVNARKELRRVFLESDYDNLIMLDDDSIIKGNDEAAQTIPKIWSHAAKRHGRNGWNGPVRKIRKMTSAEVILFF